MQIILFKNGLKKLDSRLFTGFNRFLIPNAALHLSDVRAAHHQHTKAGLADAAADGQGKLARKEHLVEGQIFSIFVYKYGNHVAPFYICEHKDFRYYDSTCRNYFDREVGSNKFEISGKIKDNTICRIDFAYKTYEITLDKCSGCSSPSPSVFYLAVNHDNYFKDEFGKTILNKIDSLPIKSGYTFDGYYRSNEYSSVNKIIDNNGYFVSKDLNDDSILYPYMKANTYTVLFDSRDVLFYSADVHSHETDNRRLKVLKRLAEGEKLIVVVSANAVFDRIIPPDMLKESIVSIKEGDIVNGLVTT